MSTKAYFCTVTGVRLVAPGVSKTVDPTHGQDDAEPLVDEAMELATRPGLYSAPDEKATHPRALTGDHTKGHERAPRTK